MANFNDIKRRVDDEKQIMIEDMDAAALKKYIHESCMNYYVDFINDNANDFNATASILDYIKKNADYDNVNDFINYSIMSVEIEVNPAEYEPIEQVDRGTPFGRLSRSGFYPDYLFAKNITITFQLDAAYIIWSIWVDLFFHYYCLDRKKDDKYIPKLPGMEILDSYGKVLYRISFFNLLYTGVSGLEFNFSSNDIEQKTITTNWVANEILMDFEPSHV